MTKKPRFIFPAHPAPNFKISPDMLPECEKHNIWLAQRKFNGSHCVIWIYQNNVSLWNRNGEPFSNYLLTNGMRQCFLLGLNRDYDTEYVLNGELLHNKAKVKTTNKQAVENTIVLYDILYAEKFLTTLTTQERLQLLYKIAPAQKTEDKKRAFVVESYEESQLWLAETFYEEFEYHFWENYEYNEKNEDQFPEIEGLILKQKEAKNTSVGSRPNDVNWMLRCRKTKPKMYQF